MKFKAQSNVNPFIAEIGGKIAKRLDAARDYLEARIRNKFSRDGSQGPSNPGTYPKRLTGQLHDGIRVSVSKGLFGLRRTGLSVTIAEGRPQLHLMALEEGFTLDAKPQGSRPQFYAIPISPLARKMSAFGNGPRKFPHNLTVKTIKRGGKEIPALATVSGSVTRKITGSPGTVHYILHRGPITVRPRKGLGHALEAEMDNLGKFFLKEV